METKALDLEQLCVRLQGYNPDYCMRDGEIYIETNHTIDYIGEVMFYVRLWDNHGRVGIIINYSTTEMIGFNNHTYTDYTSVPLIIDVNIRDGIRTIKHALLAGAVAHKYNPVDETEEYDD